MEKIFLTTGDGVKIAGEYFDSAGIKGVLLLHMMPATKESWGDFPLKLQERGFKVLAIDLRGHGESTARIDAGVNADKREYANVQINADQNADKRGWDIGENQRENLRESAVNNIGENQRNNPRESAQEKLDYRNFSDAEHQKSIQDVEEAVSFLKERGVEPENLVLIGASIGANLALEYLGEHPGAGQGVLLSAGLDYRGVKTRQYAEKLVSGQRVFLVSSEDDNGNAADNRTLFDTISADIDKKILIYKNAGHGTNMFGKEEPDLEQEIFNWLN